MRGFRVCPLSFSPQPWNRISSLRWLCPAGIWSHWGRGRRLAGLQARAVLALADEALVGEVVHPAPLQLEVMGLRVGAPEVAEDLVLEVLRTGPVIAHRKAKEI